MASEGMKVPFTGGCACGTIRYEVTAAPLGMGHCHCRDCQYLSGTGHAPALVVPPASLRVTGTPTVYGKFADSGAPVTRSFCPTCGSPLFGDNERHRHQYIAIHAGCLDDPSAFRPTLDSWMTSAQPWDAVDPDTDMCDGNI